MLWPLITFLYKTYRLFISWSIVEKKTEIVSAWRISKEPCVCVQFWWLIFKKASSILLLWVGGVPLPERAPHPLSTLVQEFLSNLSFSPFLFFRNFSLTLASLLSLSVFLSVFSTQHSSLFWGVTRLVNFSSNIFESTLCVWVREREVGRP